MTEHENAATQLAFDFAHLLIALHAASEYMHDDEWIQAVYVLRDARNKLNEIAFGCDMRALVAEQQVRSIKNKTGGM